MATRIIDVALDEAGRDRDGLAPYDHALLLLREGIRPVGQVTVPVREGRIFGAEIRSAIPSDVLTLAATIRVLVRPIAENSGTSVLTASAAICTRERPDDLKRALTALTAISPPVPVLVVDNCPVSTATRDVVAQFPGVRYVMEPKKGLDNARNRALAEADTDIIAFIDDDAVADSHWFTEIQRPFGNPDVACVTGLTMPYELENEAQETFERLAGFSKRGFYRRVFRAPWTHPLATGAIGAGANMAVRHSVALEIGGFDPALDAGTATQSGGDHEFFTRVLRAGGMIVYEPAALNWHRHRRTPDELLKAVHGYGVGVYAAWTRSFLVEREWGVFRRALGWFLYDQLPALLRSLRRPDATPPRAVVLAELSGCLKGPGAYIKARRLARAAGNV